MVYLREKKPCVGCWGDDSKKMKSCISCSIKGCEQLAETKSKLCYECQKFPCARLKQFDKRYQKGYSFSLIANLERIKTEGLKKFLEEEKVKWTCPSCGAALCVHLPTCLKCGSDFRL